MACWRAICRRSGAWSDACSTTCSTSTPWTSTPCACCARSRAAPRPKLLLLAALFHDLAKGRGGDHSELGEAEARAFCARLGLSETDADLVAWLVRHHLRMSVTAQRQDITDPAALHRFAAEVADWERLHPLYPLTLPDIAGASAK